MVGVSGACRRRYAAAAQATSATKRSSSSSSSGGGSVRSTSSNPQQPSANRALQLTQHERPHNHAACEHSVAAAAVVGGWAHTGRAAAGVCSQGKAPGNFATTKPSTKTQHPTTVPRQPSCPAYAGAHLQCPACRRQCRLPEQWLPTQPGTLAPNLPDPLWSRAGRPPGPRPLPRAAGRGPLPSCCLMCLACCRRSGCTRSVKQGKRRACTGHVRGTLTHHACAAAQDACPTHASAQLRVLGCNRPSTSSIRPPLNHHTSGPPAK